MDSSSGALGGAARAAVDALVPVIAQAPADGAMREKWLVQLFEAIQNDDPPYLELLDERWGDLCATPEFASRWADRLTDLVQHVHADRRCGQHTFTRAESACYSALFAADRPLADLIATTPGQEGKWFATAKTLKRFDLAMQLAWRSPGDPKMLIRAARENFGKAPAFAAEVALAALHWICQGRGHELTSLDVQMAYRLAAEASQALEQSERVALRIQTMLKPTTREVRRVREILNPPASPEAGP